MVTTLSLRKVIDGIPVLETAARWIEEDIEDVGIFGYLRLHVIYLAY